MRFSRSVEHLGNQLADARFEPLLVGRAVDHEQVERLLRIEHDEQTHLLRFVYVDEAPSEMIENRRAVVFGGNDDGWMAVDKPLTEKAGHGRKETLVVSIKLDGMMMIVNWTGLLHDFLFS